MGFDLKNDQGTTYRIGGGAWATYLNLAESFGWKPAGTVLKRTHAWQGGYDTNDGQTVLADDAYELCRYLVSAAHHTQFEFAVSDTIARIEQNMENLGISVTSEMRVQPQQIADGLNPLCLFLTEGAFQIL